MKKSEAAIALRAVPFGQSHLISVATPSTYGAQRKAETGDYCAKPNKPPGNGHKITDWDKFREFAQKHGEQTQVEMAARWDTSISARTISRALQKIGFTRKKRLTATVNATKPKGKNSKNS